MSSHTVIRRDPPGQLHRLCTGRCAGHPMFGAWGACGCEGGIADHTPPFNGRGIPAGWCGWEFRRCRCCPLWEERRADEEPTDPGIRPSGIRSIDRSLR